METETTKYQRAKKRVAQMQGFYHHLLVYLIINVALLVIRPMAVNWVRNGSGTAEPGFVEWVDLNILITPLLWGLVLGFHYLAVFGINFPPVRRWEEKKIKALINKDKT